MAVITVNMQWLQLSSSMALAIVVSIHGGQHAMAPASPFYNKAHNPALFTPSMGSHAATLCLL
jgi:hypothetical protein